MKSSRLLERARRAAEAERERLEESFGDFLRLLESSIANGAEEYSITPYIVPFCLPSNAVDDFELPEDIKQLKDRPPKRQRSGARVGGSEEDHAAGYPYYKELFTNKYVPPLCRSAIRPEDLDALVCSCDPEDGCGAGCQNRVLLMECLPNRCPSICSAVVSAGNGDSSDDVAVGPEADDEASDCDGGGPRDKLATTFFHKKKVYCQNTVIQRRSYPATHVFGTQLRGFGLKILEDIGADTIITEYLGEVIPLDEMMRRMRGMRDDDDFYFAALGGGLMLDAMPMGSIARFANHSCNPNCQMQKWMVMGEPRICLVSAKAMKAGDEVTYNYGYHNDGFDSVRMKRQVCRCGEPNCCGTIGGKVMSSRHDNWKTKASAVLGGSRRHSVEYVEALMEEGAALEPRSVAAEEVAQLERLVALSGRWLAVAEGLLDFAHVPRCSQSKGKRVVVNRSVTVDQALLLAEKAPRALKLDALSRWSGLAGRAPRADRALAAVLDGSGSAATGLCWDDFVSCAREVIAAMPVRCVHTYKLLQLYQSYNDWCARWFRGLARTEVATSENSVGQLSWSAVSRLSRLYGVEHFVRSDSFSALDFLEDRLYTFMRRAALKSGQWEEGYVDKALDRYFSVTGEAALEGGDFLDADIVGADGSAPREVPRAVEEDVLHCLCCLPELEGEVGVMSQCEECKRWYHPHCVNLTATKIKAGAFVCPLCTLAAGRVTAFSLAPETEWKISRADDAANARPAKERGSKREAAASSSLRAVGEQTALDACAIAGDADLSPLVALLVGSREEVLFSPGAPAVARDRLSLQELRSALEEEPHCVAVRRSPVAVLARLCLHYATSWQRRARAFLAQQRVASYFEVGDASNADWLSIEDRAVAEEEAIAGRDAGLLRECLELYFELRVLRVEPEEVRVLRQLAWLIASGPFAKTGASGASVGAPAILERVCDAGLGLGCGDTLIWRRLNGLRHRAAAVCREALVAGSEACEGVLQEMTALSRRVDLDQGFAFARLRSLALANLAAPESGDELYCWCRRASFGAMIACDQCGLWFHTRCVGVASRDIKRGASGDAEMAFSCITCSEKLGAAYKFLANFPIKY